jgi:hypothetical protein
MSLKRTAIRDRTSEGQLAHGTWGVNPEMGGERSVKENLRDLERGLSMEPERKTYREERPTERQR